MDKKYEFTGVTKIVDGVVLNQIIAVRDFGAISTGTIGGWIETESNLRQQGCSWVYGHAIVYGHAQVYGDAIVYGHAQVYGDAKVYRHAQVYGDAKVYGHAVVCDNAQVYGDSDVCGGALVYGDSQVYGNAIISQSQHVKFSCVTSDLSQKENIIESIRSQTNLQGFGDYVIAYKHVRADLSSLYDANFKYVVNEWAIAHDVDETHASCAPGLHVSHATFWEGNKGKVVLLCKVMIDDIITVQQGKIRCRKLFVMDATDVGVY